MHTMWRNVSLPFFLFWSFLSSLLHIFPTISTLHSSHSPPLRNLARGKQTCNVKALTTEMDTHTRSRNTHVWNEISAQSVGVAAIKHIKLFSFKVSSDKLHKSSHLLTVNNCFLSYLQINPWISNKEAKCWV